MNRVGSKVSPKMGTFPTDDAFRAHEARALSRALLAIHPLQAGKMVPRDVATATGFELKEDTVRSWISDGRTPSTQALAALDATYGATFILQRRKPWTDWKLRFDEVVQREKVRALQEELSDAERDLAHAQTLAEMGQSTGL
jgi:hypothetical protein